MNNELLGYASRAISSSTSLSIIELSNFFDLRSDDTLQDELCNAVPLLDDKVVATMIEKNDPDVATVVFIDDTSTSVDEILDSKTRTRSNTSIGAGRDGYGKIGLYDALTTSRNDSILSTEIYNRCFSILSGNERGYGFQKDVRSKS